MSSKTSALRNRSELLVLTDNELYTIGHYGQQLLDYIGIPGFQLDNILEELDSETNIEFMKHEVRSQYNHVIVILEKPHSEYSSISDIYMINSLFELIHNNFVDYVLVNNSNDDEDTDPSCTEIQQWVDNYIYYERNLARVPEGNIARKFKTDIYSILDRFNPEHRNSIIAFVTTNTSFIDNLFNDLESEYTVDEDGNDVDEDTGCITSEKHLSLCKGLPKLFEGWIYHVWYGEKSKPENTKDPEVEEIPEDSTDSYIARTIIVNDGEFTRTYIHIIPKPTLNLTDVMDDIDCMYIDLNTNYKDIVLENKEYSKIVIKYMITVPFTDETRKTYYSLNSNMLNLFDNMINLDKRLKGIVTDTHLNYGFVPGDSTHYHVVSRQCKLWTYNFFYPYRILE